MVNINRTDTTLYDILQDVATQIGGQATIRVYGAAHLVIFEYPGPSQTNKSQ